LPQRLDHAPHRPPPERGVAVQSRRERPAGEDAGEQPHRRAGIAAVDDFLGRAEPLPAFAFDREQPIVAGNFYAESLERLDRTVVVLAPREIGDPARAVRDRGENDGAMADRLVAGDGDLAAQRSFDRFDSPRAPLCGCA